MIIDYDIYNENFLPLSLSVSENLEDVPKITDFNLISNIGSGGMANVKLYEHKKTKAQYAIKLIDKIKIENKAHKELFAREVEMMYKINHPNIVKLYNHFEDENNCYLIMEYIKNGNLFTFRNNQPSKILNHNQCANILVDLISALYYLHNMTPNIIHRDIKLENLLMCNDNHIKLTDFGVSNYYENIARKTKVGTENYYSPEMFKNEGYDKRVDIWAIGVLLFELLCGYPPFKSDNLKQNIQNIKINWPINMNYLGKDLISKILKYNPDDRLTLNEIINHNFIKNIIPNAEEKLILPSNVKIEPFIISKNIPNDEYNKYIFDKILNNINNNNNNDNNILNEIKIKYDNLKNLYSELKKKFDEIIEKKEENEYEYKLKIKEYENKINLYINENNEKLQKIFDQKKENEILKENNKNLMAYKDLYFQEKEKNNILEKEKFNLLQNFKSNQNNNFNYNRHTTNIYPSNDFKNNFSGELNFPFFSDNNSYKNLLLNYKNENFNLKEENKELKEKLKILNEKNESLLTNNNENNNKIIYNDLINEKNKNEENIKLKKTIKNIYEYLNTVNFELFNEKIINQNN